MRPVIVPLSDRPPGTFRVLLNDVSLGFIRLSDMAKAPWVARCPRTGQLKRVTDRDKAVAWLVDRAEAPRESGRSQDAAIAGYAVTRRRP